MEVTTEQVVTLVSQAPGPPMVAVALPDEHVPAALLIWGRSQYGEWRAGVCYIYKNWHTRALITTWAPAVRVSPASRHGLPGCAEGAARNTALMSLAADLPAPVIAGLFGLAPTTATAWSTYAQADWAAYLNSRPSPDPPHGRGQPG